MKKLLLGLLLGLSIIFTSCEKEENVEIVVVDGVVTEIIDEGIIINPPDDGVYRDTIWIDDYITNPTDKFVMTVDEESSTDSYQQARYLFNLPDNYVDFYVNYYTGYYEYRIIASPYALVGFGGTCESINGLTVKCYMLSDNGYDVLNQLQAHKTFYVPINVEYEIVFVAGHKL